MVFLFLNLFLSSIFLISSGYQLLKVLRIQIQLNSVESGLFGFILLSFIALFINFFLPLNKDVNTTIFLLIIVFFIYQNKNDFNKIIETLFISLKISFIAIIFIAYSNNYDPDAFLYHLPYSNLINDYKILPGSSLIHFRFGHISLFQYLNSLFNNYIFEVNGIAIPTSLVFSFFLLYLLNQIIKIIKHNQNFTLYNFFIVSVFIFLCLRMNRYSDYGNDNIATIFFLYFISIFIKNFSNDNIEKIKYISVLSTFIFTLKVFYFVPLILTLYLWIPKINSKIINFTNIFCLFFISIWFVKNILISGCAIYPVSFTCINKLPWHNTDNKSFLSPNQVALASEAWAKNWNTHYKKEKIQGKNIEKINSQKKYIKNFFWLNEWTQDHGKFILKKIFPYIVVILILYIFCRKKISTNKINENNKLFFILFSINLLALILWFIKFPIMRYGLAYIYIQIFLIFYFIFKNKYFNKLKFIIILSLLIFLSKNFVKIINNFDNTIYPEFYKQSEYFEYKENNFITYYTKENELCGYYKSPCTNYVENLENVETKEYLSYRFYSLKDN